MQPGPPDPDRTTRILEGLQSGEQEAARELMERYQADLLRRAQRRVARMPGQAWSAEDLVQSTWFRAFQGGAIQRFRRERAGGLRAWLGVLLDRTWLDFQKESAALKRVANARASSVDDTRGGRALALAMAARDPTPTSHARYREMVAFCQTVLPPREWEAWRLVEVEEKGAAEAARHLATTEAAVRGLVHRARERILKALGERDPGKG